MDDVWSSLFAASAGVVLGVIFFGGLWWTVRRGMGSRRPALWFSASILARTSVVLMGFWYFSAGRLERLVLCLTGFIAARLAITWMVRSRKQRESISTHEAANAPKS